MKNSELSSIKVMASIISFPRMDSFSLNNFSVSLLAWEIFSIFGQIFSEKRSAMLSKSSASFSCTMSKGMGRLPVHQLLIRIILESVTPRVSPA